ncbi:10677_t:CDS:2, partial [Scutellospora calospora]
EFDRAAEEFATLVQNGSVTDEDKLKAYGLFKQSKNGDNNTAEPGIFRPTESAKWKAWTANKGISQEAAQAQYIALIEEYKGKYK